MMKPSPPQTHEQVMNMRTGDWFIAHASVRGKSHIDAGIPNQDAIHVVSPLGSKCFSVTLSDGAGSAKRAEEGATHFSRFVGQRLHELACAVHEGRLAGSSRSGVGDRVIAIITEARLALDPSLTRLKEYHCNLMAVAMGPQWGIRVHLGDAVLLKSSFQPAKGQQVDYFCNTLMTAQERSEYANETHFITQSDWTKHLQWDFLDPAGADDMYALMTDGAADIALGNVPGTTDRKVFRRFFAPLVANVLAVDESDGGNQIADALASPLTYRLTGDDKTLALLIRRSTKKYAALEPVIEDAPSKPSGSTASVHTPSSADESVNPLIPHESIEQDSQSNPAISAQKSDKAPVPNTPGAKAVKAYANTAAPPSAGKASLLGGGGLVVGLLLGLLAWPAYEWAGAPTTATAAPNKPTPVVVVTSTPAPITAPKDLVSIPPAVPKGPESLSASTPASAAPAAPASASASHPKESTHGKP